MKMLEWAREWIRSKPSGPTCVPDAEDGSGLRLLMIEDVVEFWRRCDQPIGDPVMDLLYWQDHPDEVPPCKHCGSVVCAPDLQPIKDVRPDWYFCDYCAADRNAYFFWSRIERKLKERSLAADRLGKKRLERDTRTP